jgi:predicted metalloprotease with PDZ domain
VLRRTALAFLLGIIVSLACAQDKYRIAVDLNKVKNDRVKVTVQPPAVSDSIIEYVMPAVIPGSYARKDFGRFVNDFHAYTDKGRKLKFTKSGENVFVISNPKKARLGKIEYWVDDTWDADKDPKKKTTDEELNYIFQPGGTNISAGKNYVINHQGFYGYFEKYKLLPYEITVKRPDSLFASTPLKIDRQKGKDVLYANDYVFLVDNPVMYCVPDTVSFMAGGARITVSVYSENKVVSSAEIREYITPLARALADFFGTMPVDHYMFMMYFTKYGSKTALTQYGGLGAMEHSYSSFYFLPELPEAKSRKSVVLNVSSHEFLHILTPLNMHSEEIANFDFRQPKMSMHLWMYEGATEYFANLVQVRDSLIGPDEFMNDVRLKIERSKEYPDVSFTEMSRNILDNRYKDMYLNVYQKGALISFLLDIRLNELSGGKMGLREVMLKLKEKYGPSRPFKDEQLIDDIVSLSYPQIRQYFNDYVTGSKPLPLKEYLGKIGWTYYEVKQDSAYSFGKMGLSFNDEERQFIITDSDNSNVFGLKDGDVLLSVNGKVITVENYNEALAALFDVTDLKPVNIKYKRSSEVYSAAGKPFKVAKMLNNVLNEDPQATAQQKQLRIQVLGNNK